MRISNLQIGGGRIHFVDKDNNKLAYGTAFEKIFVRFYNYFLDGQLYFLWGVGYLPFHSVRNFFYRLCGLKIGKGSTLHMGARFYLPHKISIGEDSLVGDHAFLDGRASLKIGNHVDIASRVMIYNSEHDVNAEDFHATSDPVIIEDYVFIGPGVIIQPRVTIRKGAIVAAGAVVAKDVEAFTIVGGIPAQKIGERKLKDLH